MESEFTNQGTGYAALLLSTYLLLFLRKKDVLSVEETTELVEQCLLNLETHQGLAPAVDQETYTHARQLLAGLRTAL